MGRRDFIKFALLSVSMVAVLAWGQSPTIKVEGGMIQGVPSTASDVTVFRGIPYAAPPVGNLRWKLPQPVVKWKGVKKADTFSNICWQPGNAVGTFYGNEFYWKENTVQSEDCLYLNVWTPSDAVGNKERKLPVAFWVHGGAYFNGYGHEITMDGDAWAKRGVILVTINYRLGIFGFMTHPLLTAESPHGVSGNYGILDQIAALKWVHNNIAQFGGDPDNITILGQSAGAGSVKTLVSSPLTDGLISKAIIQSGGGVNERAANAPQVNQMEILGNAWKTLFDWAGYDTLEKMRAASTDEIFGLSARYTAETGERLQLGTRPIEDGYVSKESFDAAALGGRIKDIPYMIGFTRDDMGSNGPAVDKFCELRYAAGEPAYGYQFAHALPDDEAGSHDMKGAFHSSELWFMFKSLDRSDRPFTQADWDLAEHVINCWSNFVKTGDPGEGWKAWTPDAPDYMIFNLNEDNTKDASAMGKPLQRGQ